jgi:hypothetical protein
VGFCQIWSLYTSWFLFPLCTCDTWKTYLSSHIHTTGKYLSLPKIMYIWLQRIYKKWRILYHKNFSDLISRKFWSLNIQDQDVGISKRVIGTLLLSEWLANLDPDLFVVIFLSILHIYHRHINLQIIQGKTKKAYHHAVRNHTHTLWFYH